MITNDDENFVYLTGEKGTVIVNKRYYSYKTIEDKMMNTDNTARR